jgi:hypothetical protein
MNAIWRAQDAVKHEHEVENQGDGILVWPLYQRFLKLKLKFKMFLDDIFFVYDCCNKSS